MKLNEFLERNLPDLIKKKEAVKNGSNTYNGDDLIKYFDIAIEKYTEKVCQKQIEMCIDLLGYKKERCSDWNIEGLMYAMSVLKQVDNIEVFQV